MSPRVKASLGLRLGSDSKGNSKVLPEMPSFLNFLGLKDWRLKVSTLEEYISREMHEAANIYKTIVEIYPVSFCTTVSWEQGPLEMGFWWNKGVRAIMRERSVLRWRQPRQGLRLGFELPKRSKVTGQRETSEKAEGTVLSRQYCPGLALLILPPLFPDFLLSLLPQHLGRWKPQRHAHLHSNKL